MTEKSVPGGKQERAQSTNALLHRPSNALVTLHYCPTPAINTGKQ
jgi:hypothetical protein